MLRTSFLWSLTHEQTTFSLCSSMGWGTKCCNLEKLYLYNRKFQFLYEQALWTKAFYLKSPIERLKSMLVIESQTTLLVWSCWSLTGKQRTIIHVIIFNDSISKFSSVAFKTFAEAYLFFISASAKQNKTKQQQQQQQQQQKNAEKSNASLNKKADHLLYYPQMSVFSFHTFFVLLYQFLKNGT